MSTTSTFSERVIYLFAPTLKLTVLAPEFGNFVSPFEKCVYSGPKTISQYGLAFQLKRAATLRYTLRGETMKSGLYFQPEDRPQFHS